jgi:mRNA interferase RelE/StbE
MANLAGNVQRKIARAIDGLRVDPFPQAAQTLRGSTNARRIRVGQYRVVYEVYVDRVIVYIIADGRRRSPTGDLWDCGRPHEMTHKNVPVARSKSTSG